MGTVLKLIDWHQDLQCKPDPLIKATDTSLLTRREVHHSWRPVGGTSRNGNPPCILREWQTDPPKILEIEG